MQRLDDVVYISDIMVGDHVLYAGQATARPWPGVA